MRTLALAMSFGLLAFSACGGDEGAQADASLAPDGGVPDSQVDAAPDANFPGEDCNLLQPVTQDFGAVSVGQQSASVTFTVNRVCTGTGHAMTASINGSPDFSLVSTSCGAPLGPAGSCTVVVRLAPTSVGAKSGTLMVDETPGGRVAATLTGTGVSGCAMSITPSLQDFGSLTVGTQGAPMSFTVTNPCGAATGVVQVQIVGADFTTVTNSCSAPLAPAASCAVMLRFAPVSAGAKTERLSATASPGGTVSAALLGTATP